MSRKRTKMSWINVFILAAGLGERLRPITDHIPKPLIPILGKPVLQSILEKVSTLPVNKLGMNLYHKKELIKDWIIHSDFSKMIELFPEDPILGTGGALKNARAFLGTGIFLVHNSDIISDIDLEKLLESHFSSENMATLAVHDYPKFKNLEIDERGLLKGVPHHPHPNPPPSMGREAKESTNSCWGKINNESPPSPGGRGLGEAGTESKRIVAFTGIAIYSPEFLKFLPSGISSVVDAWLNALAAGYKIGTLDVTGRYWSDLGTPASYARTVIDELRKKGETVHINPSVDWCKHVDLDGYVVIEKGNNLPLPSYIPPYQGGTKRGKGGMGGFSDINVLNKGVSLKNCIMLPETKIEIKNQEDTLPSPSLAKGMGRLSFENCILGRDFKIDLSESEMLGSSGEADAVLIGTGGSDRKYYSIKRDGNLAVHMKCAAGDTDFQRHIEYTRFFQRYSIPVPELLAVEPDNMSAFFEDLGDLSLYIWLKCPREPEQLEKIYRRFIDILILIHTIATKHVSECPLLQNRLFDYEYLRWETGYFIERFVEGIRNIRVNNLSALNDEFHRLAVKADSFPKTVIHRDFQSQNIMITKGEIPRVLDYQGARIGPPAYDVVSILWDSYCRLEDGLRERVLNYYIYEMNNLQIRNKSAELHPPSHPLEKEGRGGFLSEMVRKGCFNENEFRETILLCRLQRHMQALGAYGFLSTVKGKKYFLKYVPEGLRLLKEDVSFSKNEYPELYELVMGF
jgi:NDP-sugar pyrophosphorylase family protein/aminoglycoside/choline kinase family phosphotransferase